MRRLRGRGAAERLLAALLPLALVVFVARALPPLSLIPQSDMNASRVTASVALAKGYPIYAGPDDGRIIDFMYPPVGALVLLPAALAASPSTTLALAALITALAFFAPIAWLHLGRRTWPRPIAAASLACFALLALDDPGLTFSALTIHVDAPALGLGACACAALLASERSANLRFAVSAACAVLAVWTKQTMVPIVVALPLWVLAREGRAALLRCVAWLVALGLLVSAALVLAFGYRDMAYNMLLPAHMPWYGEAEAGRAAAALRSLRVLLVSNRWPALLIVLAAVLNASAAREARLRLRGRAWTLMLLVGVFMTPLSILGGAKVGGFLNTHSPTNYFLFAAGTLGLGAAAAASAERVRRTATLLLAVLLVLLLVRPLASPRTHAALRAATARLAAWRKNPQQQAFEFARYHPGEVYFPWNPLASLQAENRLDNSELGAWDRDLCGFPITPEHWRRYLPPAVRYLAFREPHEGLRLLPLPTARLPEFSTRVTVPGLPGWNVYERR